MKTSPISQFRDHLWKAMRGNAKGKTAEQFIDALYEASEEIWAAGIDKAYADMKNASLIDLADAFDITWLTATSIKLLKKKG